MKKISAILFVVVLLGLSVNATCSGNATEGKLLIFDNDYPKTRLLAISPVSPTGKVSELTMDNSITWSNRTASPDGKTLVFINMNSNSPYDGGEIDYTLYIYRVQDISSPVTLVIPKNIIHKIENVFTNILPVWKGNEMLLKVMWSGEEFYELTLYKTDIQNRTFEPTETVRINALANMSGCIECVLPDLSKAVMFPDDQDSVRFFGIYDTDTQKLTNFEMIGIAQNYPSWAPDGKSLVYMTNKENQICLIRVSLNGTDIQSQTVFCPELSVLPSEKMDNFSARIDWSPNGKHLVLKISGFFSTGAGSSQYLHEHFYVVRSTGTEVVTFDSNAVFGSTWSPDSRKLAFLTCTSGEKPKIYTIDADGANQNLIYTDPKVCDMSPFGPIDSINIIGWLK